MARRRPIVMVVGILLVLGVATGAGVLPARAALTAPVLIGPAQGSSHDVNPELRWGAVAGATGYRVQVARDAAFTDRIYQADTVVTSHVPSTDLDPGALHWRVTALVGDVGQAWSTGSFSMNATLGTPIQLGPAHEAEIAYPASTVLTWGPVPGAGAYEVQVTGASTITDQPIRIPTTAFAFQLLDETAEWRVRAVSPNGRTVGPWSATRTVSASWTALPEIEGPPSGPNLEPIIAWNPLPGAQTYELEVTPTPVDWASPRTIRMTTPGPAHRFTDPNEPGGGEYAWRLRGVSADGLRTDWTEVRTFARELELPAELLAPADGAHVDAAPTLRWTPVRRASHYLVDVSTDPTFSAGETVTIRTTEPELVASVSSGVDLALRAGTEYLWRVRSI
ncbi:MAG TPA: hypothetical protein VLA76_09220, partial [Candidatus Angelobacter sp.]|nr:hypothetical protein [Candidatus Angelobacter sp.]